MSLFQFACWTAESAQSVLSVEALERSESTFLAVHTPIEGFIVSKGSDIDEPREDKVLDALVSSANRHVFCVVEGQPGSGKSHLIRWLKAKWPSGGDDLPILIQRADGSLEGTLRQLREKLPSDYQYLLQGLGAIHEATTEGRARLFKAGLAMSLKADHFEEALPDAEFCEKWNLDKILNTEVVQDHWPAPTRILRILSGTGAEGIGSRDSTIAEFTLYDIMDLGKLFGKAGNIHPKALMFWRKLHNEAKVISLYQQEGNLPNTLTGELSERVPESCRLMQALNLRLNHAVQSLLGLSSNALREIFFSLRREMQKQGSRLVLFLEDITNFQGVDHELMDVLVTQSTTRETQDLCDLISIVGITPDYYQRHLAKGNYQARITHFIRMSGKGDGQSSDAGLMIQSSVRTAFAARYLRAVRLPIDSLNEWAQSAQTALPNRCQSCAKKTECHADFGSVEIDGSQVGLYPFTASAISTIFDRLVDPEMRMAVHTPRGMIQGVLYPILRQPEAISAGVFPSNAIETNLLPDTALQLDAPTLAMVDAITSEPEVRRRLVRLLALWSDRSSLLPASGHGIRITQALFEHFGLPMLEVGSEPMIVHSQVSRVTEAERHTSNRGSSEMGAAPPRVDSHADIRRRNSQAANTGPTERTSTQWNLPKVTPVGLVKRLDQIGHWRRTRELLEENYWNRALHNILWSDIPWNHIDMPIFIISKIFTDSNVKIEGTFKTKDRRAYFVAPAENWLIDGLEAHEVLRGPSSNDRAQKEEYYRQAYARLIDQLTRLVKTHIRGLLSWDENPQWNFAADAACLLALRNWLRGVTKPSSPVWEQLETVLAPAGDVTTNPRKRVDTWETILNNTAILQKKERLDALRGWLDLSPGSTDGNFCDAAAAVSGIMRLQKSLTLPATLPEATRLINQFAELVSTAELSRGLNPRVSSLPRLEARRLIETAKDIDTKLRSSTVREHVNRLKKVIQALAGGSEAPHKSIEVGHTALQRLDCMLEDGSAELVESFVDTLDDNAIKLLEPIALLEWCARAPAGALNDAREQLKILEQCVESCHDWLASYIGSHGGTESGQELVTIKSTGQKMLDSVKRLRERLAVEV